MTSLSSLGNWGDSNTPRYRVAIFAPLFPPAFKGGGPIRTLDALVRSSPQRFALSVLTGDRDVMSTARLHVLRNTWTNLGPVRVYYASVDRPLRLLRGLRHLRRTRPAVLYFNSFFDPALSILPQLLFGMRFWGTAQRLIAPRGEFGSGALGRRALKKKIFLLLYRVVQLHRGVVWHASSELEAENIRDVWGDSARILISQDETSLPALAKEAPVRRPDLGLRVIYLGRIVEHKGLHIVLEALKAAVAVPVALDIYGPEEDKIYAERCRSILDELPNNVTATFRGVLEPHQVRPTLVPYDVMVMPTAGENFGHVIAEALSVSCPVLCTPTTPWGDVITDGGGRIVQDRSVESWANALNEYANAPSEELMNRRRKATQAYEMWSAQAGHVHIFDLLDDEMTTPRVTVG
jgi:glycosyltransferase involved in cell wall biosynthesis